MAFPECFTCSLRSFHTCEVSMYILFTSYSILFWQSICSFTEVLRYFWWASGFRIIGVETHFLTCGLWPPPMDSCYWMQLSGGRTCKIFWLFQSYKIYSESIYYQYIQPKIYSELNAKWIQDLSSIANLCCSMWFNYRNIHVHVLPTRLPQHIDKDCLKHLCGTNCCVFTAHTKSSTFNKFNYENI